MSYHRDRLNEEARSRRRRDTIMQRRLRAARGEEEYIEDEAYDDDSEDIAYYRPAERPVVYSRPARGGGSGGCAMATLYMVAGGLIALVIVLIFFNQALGSVGSFLSGSPNMPAFLAAPTPTVRVSGAAVIERIQELNRLETTSYTVNQVIEASVEGNPIQTLLAGDRLLLIAHGSVEAGIDLRDLSADDVIISPDGLSLTMKMPPVQIFSVTMDNERTQVYDRQQGLLAPANRDLETNARQFAEDEILRAACEDNIMQRATVDSQQALEQFLSLLEFEQVQVIPADVPACTLPD